MTKLGREQEAAIEMILRFLKNKKKRTFSLVGAAGTGKSFTISQLLPQLECDYQLCAPTHKAAIVMRNYCGREAMTLHSMLSLSPKLDITEFDYDELEFFTTSKPNQIPLRGLVICDEASMINDDLYDLMLERCDAYHSKILFVSDKAQLLPVENTKYSKVYRSVDETFTLKKIYRQSSENCILPLLSELREHEKFDLEPMESPEGSLVVEPDRKKFILDCSSLFADAIQEQDIMKVKLLAYTNRTVGLYNSIIRKCLWKDNIMFHKGDILTAYNSGTSGHIIDGYDDFTYWNGMDYIITEVEEAVKTLPGVSGVEGYNVILYDSYNKYRGHVFIALSKLDEIAAELENRRLAALKESKLWRFFYKLSNSFCTMQPLVYEGRTIFKKTFDFGYCCTIHKSQGSSYNDVFVDMTDLKLCREDLVRRQLEYVAFSRTRHDIYIYEKHK